MSEYKKQIIDINNDLLIELHHNPLLNERPFYLRVYSYTGHSEHRLTPKDILKLSESLADFVFDNTNDMGYADNLTGLARLWHHRRNEAIKELEKYTND
jgi:hypothetical protein